MFNLLLYLILTSTLFLARVGADEEEKAFRSVHGNNNETSGAWQAVSTAHDDVEFMDLYGMDEFTPGHWEGLRDFRDDEPKHVRLCQRAHNKSGTQPPGIVDETGFCQKTLKFDNTTGYRPIELDVLLYTIKGHRKDEFRPYFFYIAKGLDPGCVYYVKPLDEVVKFVALDRHVCGIDMTNIFYFPEKEIDF